MKKHRPVHLDITKIHFPSTAIVSILHRISGVILFLFIPLLICMLSSSLASPESFAKWQSFFASNPLIKLLIWLCLAALIFHLFAGIRHIIMDTGFAESLRGGRYGAYAVMLLSAVFIILIGVWLW